MPDVAICTSVILVVVGLNLIRFRQHVRCLFTNISNISKPAVGEPVHTLSPALSGTPSMYVAVCPLHPDMHKTQLTHLLSRRTCRDVRGNMRRRRCLDVVHGR